MAVQTAGPATLQEQARELRREYPQLFAYLSERDRKLQRALRRVPSPADIELSATWNHHKFIEKTLASSGSGIETLARDR